MNHISKAKGRYDVDGKIDRERREPSEKENRRGDEKALRPVFPVVVDHSPDGREFPDFLRRRPRVVLHEKKL